jgi:hypothetical protein
VDSLRLWEHGQVRRVDTKRTRSCRACDGPHPQVISCDQGTWGTLGLDQGNRAIDLRLRGHVPAAHSLIRTISAVGAES